MKTEEEIKKRIENIKKEREPKTNLTERGFYNIGLIELYWVLGIPYESDNFKGRMRGVPKK